MGLRGDEVASQLRSWASTRRQHRGQHARKCIVRLSGRELCETLLVLPEELVKDLLQLRCRKVERTLNVVQRSEGWRVNHRLSRERQQVRRGVVGRHSDGCCEVGRGVEALPNAKHEVSRCERVANPRLIGPWSRVTRFKRLPRTPRPRFILGRGIAVALELCGPTRRPRETLG